MDNASTPTTTHHEAEGQAGPRPDACAALPGVVWITGYSAAGKTTVGRKVAARLRDAGLPTVFLDGDDLRSILGSNWGYERADRIELAQVYFRMCSHLAAQGVTVVISAVAMYDEMFEWVRTNIPRSLQAYLDVPDAERRRRDAATKQIYDKAGGFADLYDEPTDPDLRIANFGDTGPDEVAEAIADAFVRKSAANLDLGRGDHWRDYYSRPQAPAEPSPFARVVAAELAPGARLLEVGCGNGRDASFFARQGQVVTALDAAPAAIEACRREHADLGIRFLAGKAWELGGNEAFDAVYSRFVLHAMPLDEEVQTLRAAARMLRPGGRLDVECRSINDPLARQGEVISPTERIHGHYRRFIVLDELLERLADAGFEVADAVESNGLAVHGAEDPVVIRISARKPA